jgi:serine-type D-Ala-D-Ala carboxypeptidase/endopeptidase (penicillin-binding protein 4)
MRRILFIVFAFLTTVSYSQLSSVREFLSDSSMIHAQASICIRDADNGELIGGYNLEKSLIPASVMKLITSGVALELLGPQYKFTTILGYTGKLKRRSGRLSGDIIIRGGGDPALGSEYFPDHYGDIPGKWVSDLKQKGIRKIDGRVVADDSYYDFLPAPSKWLWEDLGNYYGAGVYGLSVFDNSVEIHMKTGPDSTPVIISGISPAEYRFGFKNYLIASGGSDKGYIFSAPYSTSGWITGTVPVNRDDFVLKASITDPPLFIAELLNERLEASGIKTGEKPSTGRSEQKTINGEFIPVSEIISPPLSDIIKVLNHESVNLFAEHLLKEIGKVCGSSGSTAEGIKAVNEFLLRANISTDGMFIEDGSGLSPADAINSGELVNFLVYMRNKGKYFKEYLLSLPDAGKEGTLTNCFRDPVFGSRLNAKSGSMTRVRCYAGYFTTGSGRNMAFSILVNNYTGPADNVIKGIENIIKEIILNK